MRKTRVLLVDYVAVIRKVLGDLIASDPALQVAGTAANGRIALDRPKLLKSDIVTQDIEMPEMEGLQTVREIRKRGFQAPSIMCRFLTATGARRTLDSLPSAVLSVEEIASEIVKRGASTRDALSTSERRI